MFKSSRYLRQVDLQQFLLGVFLLGSHCLWGAGLVSAQTGQAPHASRVIPVQASEPQSRLDAQIVSMPKVQRKLEIVHNRSQLVQTRSRVTRMAIADPSVIDVAPFEEKEFAIIGTNLGSTTLTLWFEGDDTPLIYEVKVIRDPNIEEQLRVDYGKLERKIAILFPNSKVYLIPLHDKLVIKGQARDAAEAARILQIVRGEFLNDEGGLYGPNGGRDRMAGGDSGRDGIRNEDDLYSGYLVNMLQVPGEFQVMLHVTIAELNRSQARRMGVDLAVVLGDGRHIIASTLAGGPPTLSGIFENGDVSVLVNALATNGTAKILSRPSLTTMSGHPAQFLAGGEFAVPTIVGVGGAQGTSTQFRGFGTSMTVVPTIVGGDLVRLRISPEFSQINLNNSVGGIPGLDSRRIQTTVELREGQTIVLGGLLSRQSATQVSRIPLLGELPWVGPLLFNNKRATEDELELIVLVSPEIVRPMDPEEVPPMPGYYVTHPNDTELYRYAMTEGAPDLEVYQLAPYGNKVGAPDAVGFNLFNPSHATPQNGPIPQGNQPNGFPTPAPWTEQSQNSSSRYQGANDLSATGMNSGGMTSPQRMNDPPMMAPPSYQHPEYYQQPQMQYQQPMMSPNQNFVPEGYQQAPPAYRGTPPTLAPPTMTPQSSPGGHSYRGSSPTASTMMPPGYSQNSQNPQPGSIQPVSQTTNGAPNGQPRYSQPQGYSQQSGYSQPGYSQQQSYSQQPASQQYSQPAQRMNSNTNSGYQPAGYTIPQGR